MKKVIFLLAFTALAITSYSQVPSGFNYQAILRNSDGTPKANETVSLQISIVNNSSVSSFMEIHNIVTNEFGYANVIIGEGTSSEDLSSVDWANGPYFLDIIVNGEAMGSSPLLSVPYALYAASGIPGPQVKVGDFAQGGIVFWVDETGQHGLVCTKSDQASGIQWYNNTYTNTEAHGDGIGAGEMNTVLIIANQGSNSNMYAAGICANLVVTENGIAYGGWYLPSKIELDLIYQNKELINETALANGGSTFHTGDISTQAYWSSTEEDDLLVWKQNLGDGHTARGQKNTIGENVRAIRAF